MLETCLSREERRGLRVYHIPPGKSQWLLAGPGMLLKPHSRGSGKRSIQCEVQVERTLERIEGRGSTMTGEAAERWAPVKGFWPRRVRYTRSIHKSRGESRECSSPHDQQQRLRQSKLNQEQGINYLQRGKRPLGRA